MEKLVSCLVTWQRRSIPMRPADEVKVGFPSMGREARLSGCVVCVKFIAVSGQTASCHSIQQLLVPEEGLQWHCFPVIYLS